MLSPSQRNILDMSDNSRRCISLGRRAQPLFIYPLSILGVYKPESKVTLSSLFGWPNIHAETFGSALSYRLWVAGCRVHPNGASNTNTMFNRKLPYDCSKLVLDHTNISDIEGTLIALSVTGDDATRLRRHRKNPTILFRKLVGDP